jgi:FkbM family methyltransferase
MNVLSGFPSGSLIVLLFGVLLLGQQITVVSVVHQEAGFDLYDQIYNLAQRGILDAQNVRFILDVGAFDGEFSDVLRSKGYFPNAQFLCIEANSMHVPTFQIKKLPYVISLIGDKDDEDVNYYRVDTSKSLLETGNSIFRENSIFFDDARIETRKSFTIDHILKLLNVTHAPVDILKLDIQGSELNALRGAKNLIERSPNVVIITEMSFVPYNGAEAPSSFDIHYEMEKMGFQMIDILGYSSGQILHGNGEYVRYALQFDAAWVRRERLNWRGVLWPKKAYPAIAIDHDNEEIIVET